MLVWLKALSFGKKAALGAGAFMATSTLMGFAMPNTLPPTSSEDFGVSNVETINDVATPASPAEEKRTEEIQQSVPFETQEVSDSTLEKGKRQTRQTGVVGIKVITYEVTYLDGTETVRTVIKEEVTKQPVTQIVAVGTYVKPEPVASTGGGCDPNYSGGCVPIDSDVDCGGGSGNGPSYFYGTATVVGSDIYDLDRDNDNIACEKD